MSKKIAILATDGFEEVELTSPKKAFEKEGFEVEIIGEKSGTIKSWQKDKWGKDFEVDKGLNEASAEDYDALFLPVGALNPDKLRMNEDALTFVRQFFEADKIVASLCHGPWTLIDAEVVVGKKLTSYKSISRVLKNAGVHWLYEEIVRYENLIISRAPDDLPAFNAKVFEVLKQQ